MQETRRLVNEKCPQAEVCLSRVDVSDETSVEEFYSATVQKFGRIDYGANIAGIAQAAAPIHLSPDEAFDKMYAVNQKGVCSTVFPVVRLY
jgi:NAD(P)-dependent dehydrogenase (short-subunit alcohol dehydrogenase family)